MKTLREALLKAGVTTDADVKRLEREARQQAKEQSEQAALELALQKLPPTIRLEIAAWQIQTKRSVPVEIIKTWADLPRQLQTREWARWLSLWRGEEKPS